MTLLAVCGSTHRESYLDIVMVGIVSALIALVAVIALARCLARSKMMRAQVARHSSSQCEIRYAYRQIKSDLAFDRQRLQRYRAAGSADQHLGAHAQA